MSSSTDPGAASTGAEAAVEALIAEGVDHVFGLPGTTIMDVIDVLGRRDDIRYLSVRHEQAAAHMADGFWRASGRIACALASRGPGAANLAIGVHNAFAESVPLLAIVGQVPDAIAHRDAFEEMDLVSFFRPMTKWAVEVHSPDRVGELVRRGVRMSLAGRSRPVLVSVALNALQGEAPGAQRRPAATIRQPAPDAADLEAATDLLAAAQRPVLLLGGGMLRGRWCDAAVDLAEALDAPVVTTWFRKNAFPNDHRLFAGSLGYGAHPSAEAAVRDADVLLALGCRFSEFTTKRYSLVDPATRIVHVDIDAEEIGAVYPAAVGIAADAWGTARALAGALRDADRVPERAARADGLRARYVADARLPADDADAPEVRSSAVVRSLARAVTEHDAIIVQDTHSFGPWLSRYVPFHRPGTYYAAAGGSMGWGVPAALGVRLARPDEAVIAVCGDGSFWMVAQELETAVRERLPVVFVITNNFSYGNTRDRQRHAHGGRYVGVFHSNPDFAAFARLLGGHGERVERDADLDGALDRALRAGVPAIVDVIQHPHEGLPGDLQPLAAR